MHYLNTIVRSMALAALLVPGRSMGQGQQGSGSPYSAYGLGEFVGTIPVAQAAKGGLGEAVVDPASTVTTNPASYPTLFRTTFEMGLGVRSSTFATAGTKSNGRRTDLMGLSFGVPFGNGRWGLGLVVRPVTKVNYRLQETQAIPNTAEHATFTYTGEGGLNQAMLGAGVVLSQKHDSLVNGHRLSVGANVGYLFGNLETSGTATFPSGQGFYATRVTSSLIVRDPTLDLGVQYQGDLRKRRTKGDDGLYFLAGVSAELPVRVSARRTDVVNTYGYNSSGVEVPLDTTFHIGNDAGAWGLPLGLNAGFTVFNDHWILGAEYRQRDWSSISVSDIRYGPSGELAMQHTIILGGAYRVSTESIGPLFKRATYRAGGRLTNDHVKVGGTRIEDRALTVGVSLPLMANTTRSRLNIGGEFGERGTLENGLLRERYATLLVGITITPDLREGWFKKRRID